MSIEPNDLNAIRQIFEDALDRRDERIEASIASLKELIVMLQQENGVVRELQLEVATLRAQVAAMKEACEKTCERRASVSAARAAEGRRKPMEIIGIIAGSLTALSLLGAGMTWLVTALIKMSLQPAPGVK
jgi:hypothetical protein